MRLPFNKDAKNLLILALFVLLLLLSNFYLYRQVRVLEKEKTTLITSLEGYELTGKQYRETRTKDSAVIATQAQTIMSQNDAIKLGLLKLEERMRKVESSVGFQYDIYIDSVKVPFIPPHFGDTTKFVRNENGKPVQDSVAVPKKFSFKDKWFTISGDILKSGLFFDSISVPNKSQVTVGWERKNFLSKMKPVVQIKNDNPYIRLNEVNNVVIKKQKGGILQSKVFWTAIGIAAGFYIHQKL